MKFVSTTTVVLLTLFTITLAPLLLAKPKGALNNDISICSGKQTAVYGNCLKYGGSEEQCWQSSERRYNQCMQQRGNASGTYPPIKPSPTPKGAGSIHPINGGPTSIKSAKATPSPTPKPGPSPSPQKKTGDHHHG